MKANIIEIHIGEKTIPLVIDPCTYKPSDDSYLAIRLMEKIARQNMRFKRILDLCTGTGILARAAYEIFKPNVIVATDISPYSVLNAIKNLPEHALVVRCDLAKCLKPKWDLVIVNPPYLPPGEESPRNECEIYLYNSWSNLETLERACYEAASIGRRVLFVYSSLSPIRVEECLKSRGFRIIERIQANFFMETIYALYAVKKEDNKK